MADISYTHTGRAPAGSIWSRLGRKVWNGLEAIAEANPRVRQADALNRLSDEQLAARGLRREDIARYVYRDIMYL